jgi:hypothetical protein
VVGFPLIDIRNDFGSQKGLKPPAKVMMGFGVLQQFHNPS